LLTYNGVVPISKEERVGKIGGGKVIGLEIKINKNCNTFFEHEGSEVIYFKPNLIILDRERLES
jgi:hypothetical protein